MRCALGQLTSIRTGYLSRKGIESQTHGSHALVQIRDFNATRTELNTGSLMRFNPDPSASAQPLRAGDVLFLAKGQWPFAYAVEELPVPALAASYFFVLSLKPAVNPAYLAWYLNRETVIRSLTAQAGSGVFLPVIRKSVLENLPIQLPPPKTQLQLVELDRLARQEEALLAELGRKRRALLDFYNRKILHPFEETGAQP